MEFRGAEHEERERRERRPRIQHDHARRGRGARRTPRAAATAAAAPPRRRALTRPTDPSSPSQGSPLYVATPGAAAGSPEAAARQAAAHAALDAADEAVAAGWRAAPGAEPDCFLGALGAAAPAPGAPAGRVYGYATPTRVRLLLAAGGAGGAGGGAPGDEALRAAFARLHAAFAAAAANPFYTPGAPLASPRFEAAVAALVAGAQAA